MMIKTELQELVDYIRTKHTLGKLAKLPPIELSIRDNVCSRAKRKGNRCRIVIAKWNLNFCVERAYATTIHEMSHFIAGFHHNHDKHFKAIETVLLADFGLKPVGYKRAYYNQLQTLNGKTVW